MVRRGNCAASVLLLVALSGEPAAAPPAAAARRPLPTLVAAKELAAGVWVQYSIVPRAGQPIAVRLLALEREAGAQWFEIGLTDGQRRTLLLKLLVEGGLIAPKRVRRAIVQPPGQQPFYLPDRLARRELPAFRESAGPGARLVGRERVKVPAGSFQAERYRSVEKGGKTVDAWLAREVAGWPMVKLAGPDLLLELVAHGTKGSTQVRGRPAKIDERLLPK
jgi:hypothetical protein